VVKVVSKENVKGWVGQDGMGRTAGADALVGGAVLFEAAVLWGMVSGYEEGGWEEMYRLACSQTL